ncbi:hypothetical protein [Thermomonospora amylolytica]|uniref:hypothetical protein n=1 Tax=Thermomonospora amylolytica TaxID=1411117 RepID=UPI0013001C97|nr:hypothetical protein [Thermomonospora amylolytica]
MPRIRPLVAITAAVTLCVITVTGCLPGGEPGRPGGSPSASVTASPGDDRPGTPEPAPPTESGPSTAPPPSEPGAPTPVTPSSPAPGAPTPEAGTPTPTPGAIRFASPVAAIEHLAQARRRNDRTDALRAANAATVDYVFGFPPASLLTPNRDCRRTPSGPYAYHCFYYYEGGGLNYYVNFSATSGFLVVRALFVAD